MIIVLRAGGVGSRLWPVSRTARPKQFHALVSGKTLLQESFDRVRGVTAPENIYLSLNRDSAAIATKEYTDILSENIIYEPVRRDTAAAIGLESIIIAQRDPHAIVASLGSDHSVKRTEEFQRLLHRAENFIKRFPDYILALGIHPTHAETGYGYIHYDQLLDDGEPSIARVHHFSEKPNAKDALAFLEKGHVLWNANMFVWRVQTIVDLYKKHLPAMYEQLMEIQHSIGTDSYDAVLARVYPAMQKIAVDYGIIEKAENIAVLPADIGWSDIGDWARLKDELAESEKDNVVLGATHVSRDTVNTLVSSAKVGKIIATIGVANLVIVDTDDALLVCDKYHSDEVKELIEQIKANGHNDVL